MERIIDSMSRESTARKEKLDHKIEEITDKIRLSKSEDVKRFLDAYRQGLYWCRGALF